VLKPSFPKRGPKPTDSILKKNHCSQVKWGSGNGVGRLRKGSKMARKKGTVAGLHVVNPRVDGGIFPTVVSGSEIIKQHDSVTTPKNKDGV